VDEIADSQNRAAEAEAAFAAGQLMKARTLAVEGLVEDPDDAGLLRVAGRASLELELDEAARHLRALVKVAPDDVDGWRDLAFAEVEAGDLPKSADAFAKVLELAPDDVAAMVHLAHARHALGQQDEALSLLLQAADRAPTRTDILRSLTDMARAAGQTQTALEGARRLAEADPKNVLAALDTAELLLADGQWRLAANAFGRLRTVDTDDGHEAVACHGQAEALVRAESWRQALDVTIDATRLDRHQLTTDLLAFIASKLFGEADREAKSWDELAAALDQERVEHRRTHEEAAVL
jgi:tetratricopeptide (TPR) repeat protein